MRPDNVLPRGLLSGVHGLCAIGDDRFYLLGRDNEVMAVPLPAFREVCAKRVEEIKAMTPLELRLGHGRGAAGRQTLRRRAEKPRRLDRESAR